MSTVIIGMDPRKRSAAIEVVITTKTRVSGGFRTLDGLQRFLAIRGSSTHCARTAATSSPTYATHSQAADGA